MNPLDRRLHAYRADLADERLQGHVDAARFVPGTRARVTAPVVDVHSAANPQAGVDTQFLYGDEIRIFEARNGWAWVQAERDGYVGYIDATMLGEVAGEPTHVVCVPRSFVYPEAELKAPRSGTHSLGARVGVVEEVENRGTRYAILESGEAMIARHLRPVSQHDTDYVTVAESLIYTPYLWGGTSGFGIDCSGLIQLSMRMADRNVVRDTDMQAAGIGVLLEQKQEGGLLRGDLVFWKGHVAIMLDGETALHANGYTMMVSREPLEQAIARIKPFYGEPTGYRRPDQ